MTFEADLKAHLAGDSTLSGLVGDRIFPAVIPQRQSLPAVTYQAINGTPQTDLSGDDGQLVNYRMQINCWAESYLAAKALAEAVRGRLKTAASSFKALPLLTAQDVFEENPKRFGVYMDFSFWYRSS